jgi:hypothetical protein
MRSIRTALAVALPLAIAASVASTAPALAKGGTGEVRKSGVCSPSSSAWKLKAKPDNGRLEVEFEVDSNVVGQTWNWKLFDNNAQVATGTAKTVAPSGSFEVRRLIANKAGTDNLRARATNPATGQVCQGTLSI